jgi:hypothetical protein
MDVRDSAQASDATSQRFADHSNAHVIDCGNPDGSSDSKACAGLYETCHTGRSTVAGMERSEFLRIGSAFGPMSGETQLTRPVATWFKAFVLLCGFICVISVASVAGGLILIDEGAVWSPLIAWYVVGGAALFVPSVMVTVSGLAALFTRGRMAFDGRNLMMDAGGRSFVFAREAVRAVVLFRRRRGPFDIGVDVSRPPLRMFSRRSTAELQIEVAEGRIRLFKDFALDDLRQFGEAVAQKVGVPFYETDWHAKTPSEAAEANGYYGKDRICLVWMGFIVAAVLIGAASWFVLKGWSTEHWPAAIGRVTNWSYAERGEGGNDQTIAEIRYVYHVDGREYANDSFGVGTGPGQGSVRRFLKDHPAGSEIWVYYNPAAPEESVVIPGVDFFGWMLAGGGVVVALLVLPLWWQGPRHDLNEVVRPYRVAPGVPIGYGVALTEWKPPGEVFEPAMRRVKRAWFWMAVRIGLASSVVLAGFHAWVPRLGIDLPWHIATLGIGGYVAVLVMLMLACAIAKRTPPTFRLFERGIAVSGRTGVITWDRYTSFRVGVVAWALGHRWLVLVGRKGSRREIPLPGDARDQLILTTVKMHLQEDLSLRDVD